jgi:abhydrolase domain-containing protein 2
MFSSLAAFLVLVVFLRGLYLTVSRFWWRDDGRRPSVHYRKDSRLCPDIVRACTTLTHKYRPPLLWGGSGHIQTAYNVLVGHVFVPSPVGDRRSLSTPDGSTVTYDLYQPQHPSVSSLFFLLCPGIGNCSETIYIRSFVHYLLSNGHTVAVLNHVGTLGDVPVTGNRLFTYGGTGDLAAVFEDLLSRHPSSQWVLVGFSLGANIGVRFIGERVHWRSHFLCAVSVCQGYDPNQAVGIFPSTSKLSKLYSHRITSEQLSLMRRHRSQLLGETPLVNLRNPTRRNCKITHRGHDCNGFALDVTKIAGPSNEALLWMAKSIHELDEYYTRRVLGFESVRDLWQWMSCVEAVSLQLRSEGSRRETGGKPV